MESTSPSLQQVEEIKPEAFSPLFTKVQKIYIQQFREWFAITAPTSVLATVVLVWADRGVNTIFRQIPAWTLLSHPAEIAEMYALRLASYFFLWFLGCFALAATATVVSRLDGEDEDLPLRGSHQRAREHLGAIFIAAIATFLACILGIAILQFADLTISKVFGYKQPRLYVNLVLPIGYLIMVGIVARLGMAIPLLVRGDIGVWAALNESLKIGERHKGFLYLLLIQSVVGSYVGWYVAHFALLLVPYSIKVMSWYGWGALIVSALASAAVSPPMFIGFSVLAEEYKKEIADQSTVTLPS